MWTDTTVELLSQVTVVAENLNPTRVAMRLKPNIEVMSTPLGSFPSMFRPVVVDMVYAEKVNVVQPTTGAFPSVVRQHLVAEFYAPSLLDSLYLSGVLFRPLSSVDPLVGSCFILVFLVVDPVVLVLLGNLFYGQRMFFLPLSVRFSNSFFLFWCQFSIIFFSHTLYYIIGKIKSEVSVF